ncbi:hypothetical protein ACCD05_15720, partial [Rhizobium sp. Rhizsp42]
AGQNTTRTQGNAANAGVLSLVFFHWSKTSGYGFAAISLHCGEQLGALPSNIEEPDRETRGQAADRGDCHTSVALIKIGRSYWVGGSSRS